MLCVSQVLISFPFMVRYAMRYMISSQMNFFYSDTLLVPLWWIAFTVVVAVSVDALTDPVFGAISDQCRSRWGRRRPFLAMGSIAAGILFALIWMPCVFGLCPSDEEYLNLQVSERLLFLVVEGHGIALL